MIVKLTKPNRIEGRAGEIVEVSPAEAGFLLSTGSAVEIFVTTAKRETPEDAAEKETPEAAAAQKTTKKKTTGAKK